jgi:hypothetical protein
LLILYLGKIEKQLIVQKIRGILQTKYIGFTITIPCMEDKEYSTFVKKNVGLFQICLWLLSPQCSSYLKMVTFRKMILNGYFISILPLRYIKDAQKELDTITIESQGKEGFVKEKHEYLIY